MKCGLREVPDAFDLPEVVFHSNDRFPGETLKAAADLGSQHFGTEARIIFVLLPDNGATWCLRQPRKATLLASCGESSLKSFSAETS